MLIACSNSCGVGIQWARGQRPGIFLHGIQPGSSSSRSEGIGSLSNLFHLEILYITLIQTYISSFNFKMSQADGFQLDKLFHKQRKGSIMKASKEKIEALRQHKQGSAGIWPFGSFSSAPYNLFSKQPSKSNQYGSLYEALPNDYKQLQDLDLSIYFANITKVIKKSPILFSNVFLSHLYLKIKY